MRVYVASSWRNDRQPAVVAALQRVGHEVYDFRYPDVHVEGFAWENVDAGWREWTPEQFREALQDPLCEIGFGFDMAALMSCDAAVLVMPCGRSAHLELGWAAGAGKRTIILLAENAEPELMYRMADRLCISLDEVLTALK